MNTAPSLQPVEEIVGNPQILAFLANQTVESDMPRQAVEEYWDLYITGTLTLSGYSTAPTSFVEALLNLVKSIQVKASAAVGGGVNETFKNVDANYLAFIDYMYESVWPDNNFGVYTVPTSNAAHSFIVTPRLYFTDPIAEVPSGRKTGPSTMLDTRLLSALKLDIAWQDQTAMVYGGVAGTAALSNTQLQVKATHYFGVSNVVTINGKQRKIVRNYLRELQTIYPVVNTTIDYQFNNLRVGTILHRLTIKGLVQPSAAPSSVSYADPSDVLLQGNTTRATGANLAIKINGNAYIPVNGPTKMLQASNLSTFKLTKGLVPGYQVYETSITHNPKQMLNNDASITMQMFADTDFTSGVNNNVQFTYVERVTPQ